MKTATRISILALVCLFLTSNLTPALADPLPGRDILKFQQLPMDATPVDGATYFGHDELSTIESTSFTDMEGGHGLNFWPQFLASLLLAAIQNCASRCCFVGI